jgi:hypothetical protein
MYPTVDAAFYAAVAAAQSGTLIGATGGPLYADESKVTIDPAAGTIAIAGAIVPLRGSLVVAAGATVTAGYLYGTQGKITVKGTLNHPSSEYSAALVGQLDLSAAVALTSGVLSMAWLDAGAASAVSLASVSALTITNSIALKPLAAIFNIPLADASFFLISQDSGDSRWSADPAASGKTFQNVGLKVKCNTATYWIPLYA